MSWTTTGGHAMPRWTAFVMTFKILGKAKKSWENQKDSKVVKADYKSTNQMYFKSLIEINSNTEKIRNFT